MTTWEIGLIPWYVLMAYFAFTALRMKRPRVVRSASGWSWTPVLAAGFFLIFGRTVHVDFWNARFIPKLPSVDYLAIAIVAGGVAITLWARYVLGEYWSGQVRLKADHKLIQSGPYAYVRHPLYTGILVGLVGSVLLAGEWRAVIGLALAVIGFSVKARQEEALLSSEFKSEYVEYRSRTGFLLPRLRASTTS